MATQGTMRGGLIFPTIFNVVLDNMVRKGLEITAKDQVVAHEGLVLNVCIFLGVFYTEDRMIGSQDSEWLQNALNVPIGLIWRYGLITNITK